MLFLALALTLYLSFYVGHFPGWFDSGELATAAHLLGVAHSPGHIGFVLAGHLANLLPIGSVAYRIALLSSLCSAISVVLLMNLSRRFIEKLTYSKDTIVVQGLAFVGSTLFLFHPSIALQSTRIEVYALQTVLLLGAIWMGYRAMESEEPRYVYLLAFLFGLSFVSQPILTATIAIPLLLPLLWLPVDPLRVGLTSLPFFLFGNSLFLFLPLRASASPILNWDAPVTWPRFWGMITARDFQAYFYSPIGSQAYSNWARGDLWSLLPPSLLILSILGLAAIWKRVRPSQALFFGALSLFSTAAWLFKDFHLQNPDSHAYVTLPIAFALLLAPLGGIALFQRIKSFRTRTLFVLTAILLFFSTFRLASVGFVAHASNAGSEAEALSRHLDRAPPDSLIKVGSDHWLFPLWYRSYVEKQRRDVALVGKGMLQASWYQKQLIELYGSDILQKTLLTETNEEKKSRRMGYLYGSGVDTPWLRSILNLECRKISSQDPFEIRKSLCAKIAVVGSADPNPTTTILLLENFLGKNITSLSCQKAKPVSLPYPLFRDRPHVFILRPDHPQVDLALLYLGCDRPDLAATLLQQAHPGQGDQALLFASLLWARGEKKKSMNWLRPTSSSTKEQQGIFALARASLYAVDRSAGRALHDLQIAGEWLPNDPAVLRLREALGSLPPHDDVPTKKP